MKKNTNISDEIKDVGIEVSLKIYLPFCVVIIRPRVKTVHLFVQLSIKWRERARMHLTRSFSKLNSL